MPTILEAPAKAAPAAPSAPVQTGSAVPSGKGVIHVTQSGMSTTPTDPAKLAAAPAAPAAPVVKPQPSARDKMEEALGKKVKGAVGVDPFPEKPTVPDRPSEELSDEVEEPVTAPAGETKPVDPKAAKPKVNPWKLVDEHKAARANLEKEIAELKKLVPNEELRKREMTEVEQIRARAKELEDEIRYVNYEKSAEFRDKYDEPYRKSWQKAMGELSELSVNDPETGQSRAFTANEMLRLVNMPLGEARQLADDLYGPLASDVMLHRKEIKNMFEARSNALAEAKTNGDARVKQQTEAYRNTFQQIGKTVADAWTNANKAIAEDEKYGQFFKPVEGDEEGNQRLTKGYEFADKALSENPMDPKLTPEQRETIVKRHAALRNRAAAFGRLVIQANKYKDRIAELEKELGQFKGSAPSTVGEVSPKATGAPMTAMQQLEDALGKIVKPQR